MSIKTSNPFREWFRKFANHASNLMGTPWAFAGAVGLLIAWLLSKPLFSDDDTWQLVINTATTIITFVMVFLIQNTQNRDNKAIQLKLDELILVTKKARNKLMDLEDCTDEDIETLQREFEMLRKKQESSTKRANTKS